MEKNEFIRCTVCGNLHTQRIGISTPKSNINFVCSLPCLLKHRFILNKNAMVYNIDDDERKKLNMALQAMDNMPITIE